MAIVKVLEFEPVFFSQLTDCVNTAPSQPFPIRPELISSGFVRVEKKVNGSSIEDCIVVNGRVGLIPINDSLSLWVEPRVPVANLDYIAKKNGGVIPDGFSSVRGYMQSLNSSEDVLEKIGYSFVQLVSGIRQSGFWKDYRRRQYDSSNITGRIDFAKTMRKYQSRGIEYCAISFGFERTPEVEANFCLQYALEHLAANNSLSEGLRAQAHSESSYCKRFFSTRSTTSMPDFDYARHSIPRSRPAYSSALPLAQSIVANANIDLTSIEGTMETSNLLINMSRLFENYMRNVIREIESAEGWRVMDGNDLPIPIKLFSKQFEQLPSAIRDAIVCEQPSPSSNICPDILVYAPNTQCLLADVKYKPVSGVVTAKRSDIAQMITYATRLSVKNVLTIHPCRKGQRTGLYYSGTIGTVNVFCFLFNLASEEIAEDERMLKDSILCLAMNN